MEEELPSKMKETKSGDSVGHDLPPEKMQFEQLKQCVDEYFDKRDYMTSMSYKKGFAINIGEDYSKIDLVCNMTDILYNMCSEDSDMSPEERQNFRNLCKGITLLNKSLKQYDKKTNNEYVAVMTGYILKLIRNYIHD